MIKKILKFKIKKNQGFSLIETLVAIFILSIATISIFSLATRTISLNRGATRLQLIVFYADDAFSLVEKIRDNNFANQADWLTGLSDCISPNKCSIYQEPDGQITVNRCGTGICAPLIRDQDGFLVQPPFTPSGSSPLGFYRELTLEPVPGNSDEILAKVTIRSIANNPQIERVFERRMLNWFLSADPGDYVRINYRVIECSNESFLPNWGTRSSIILASTSNSFLNTNQGNCWPGEGFYAQWGYEAPAGNSVNGVKLLQSSNAVTGEAVPTGEFTNQWKTVGPSDENGIIPILVTDLKPAAGQDNAVLAFRQIVPSNAFVFFQENGSISAELHCHTDYGTNDYNNFERINAEAGGTNVYFCIAFMAPAPTNR